MTALLNRPLPGGGVAPDLDTSAWAIGAPRLLAGLEMLERLDLAAHLQVHGALPGTDLARVTSYLDASRIAGRGGAGFELGRKLRSLAEGPRHVIVNGSESEPASRKDRVLMRRTPHLVLDGALALAAAVGAKQTTIAVHDERSAVSMRHALAERRDGRHAVVTVLHGGSSGVRPAPCSARCGAGRPSPTGRRTPPTVEGVVISNVETFAQLAVLLRMGPSRFAATGAHDEPGTTLLTVGGAVARPGVVEIPIGTPLGIVLTAAHAAPAQAVVVGGYHGAWLAPVAAIRLSRDGVRAAGGSFGAGVVLVVDDATCAVGELARVAVWLAGESARQCGPCAFGLPALAADVAAVAAGQAAGLSAAFDHVRAVDGRGACAHPDGAARFVASGLHVLQNDTDLHLRHGGCGRPVLGRLPIGANS